MDSYKSIQKPIKKAKSTLIDIQCEEIETCLNKTYIKRACQLMKNELKKKHLGNNLLKIKKKNYLGNVLLKIKILVFTALARIFHLYPADR